ncbi:MAG: LysM peptidoglycan-binding domain-containing protein [Verrucomicrobia bacterium]|nr:LysM peptidoglycan-binding domain-containing protein [Verrucomicrobiota bacterium]
MSRFKIVLFFVVTGLAGACVAAAWWLYTHVIGEDAVVVKQIKQIQVEKKTGPDPSLKRFDKAIETLRENTEEGREALYELLRYFPDSTRAPEAKRIIGEMNLDALFSPNQNSTRKDYIVQPGDSLGRIASKNATTVECLLLANSMMSSALQPGDHLFVFPLDFEILVSVNAKTLALLRHGRFFKEYQAIEVRLPGGFKAGVAPAPLKPGQSAPPAVEAVTAAPATSIKGSKKHHPLPPALPPGELTLNDKAAWVDGKRVAPANSHFIAADKWLMGSRAGFNIRALPVAKPVDAPTTQTTSTTTTASTAKPPKSTTHPVKAPKPVKVVKPVMAAVEDDEDATAAVPETGVFLAREDIEELFTIIRPGTKVRVVK